MTMTDLIENPYVGPRPFEQQEADRFFGREAEARELLARVISERLLLFYAPSGAGKTSLLNTRLIPQLKAEGYAVLPVVRVGAELPDNIRSVDNLFVFNVLLRLHQGAGEAVRFAKVGLTDFLARLTSDDGKHYYYDDGDCIEENAAYEAPIHVLIIDQFEEIFTTHLDRWSERESFFRQLDEAMTADPMLWVVLLLREDYVAALDPYAGLLTNRLRARFYMQRMGYEAALAAIRRPAEQYGRPFAPGVAEMLVDNLRQIRVRKGTALTLGQFVEPVQLQVVCYQLWEKLKKRETGFITEQDLRELGDIDAALANFYEQALAEVLQAGRISEMDLRNWFEQKLITEARTRSTIYQNECETAGLPNEIVRMLADHYLLRVEPRAGGEWYELVHDRFVEPILQANERWLQQQNRLIQDAWVWEKTGKDSSKLYVGERLKETLGQLVDRPLEKLIQCFLEASQAEEQTRVRWETAKQETLRSQSLFLAEMARQQNQQSNFTLGMLLALEALPKNMAKPERPYIIEAELQLYRSVVNLREILILGGHKGAVVHAAFSPDGSHIVTTSNDNTARLWNTANGQLVAILGHKDVVWHAAFSPDSSRLATASEDKTVRLWNTDKGRLLTMLTGHEKPVVHVTFNGNGSRLVTASNDNTGRLWDTGSYNLVATLSGHKKPVVHTTFSHDGNCIATVSEDKTVKLWNADNGQLLATLDHSGAVRHVAFSPDDSNLATASADRKAQLWDTTNGQLLATLTGHKGVVWYVAFSPNGSHLATASADKTVRLWDTVKCKRLAKLTGHTDDVWEVAFSPDGSYVVTASNDKTARLWNATSGKPLAALVNHIRPVVCVAFSPNGNHLITASLDQTARLWDTSDSQLLATLTDHTGPVTKVVFSNYGTRLITASLDRTARLWDITNGKLLTTLTGHERAVWYTALSPNDSYLATASEDTTARLWNATSGQLLFILAGHESLVVHAVFSPDSGYLATSSADKTVRLWETASGHWHATLKGHEGPVWYAAFSPDGSRLATASEDATVRLWDTTSGRLLTTLRDHERPVRRAVFSPGGNCLATASDDTTARLWDAVTGKLIAILAGHEDCVVHIAFNPQGNCLATVSYDTTGRLWDVASGRLLATLSGHAAKVLDMAFSTDGARLATASADNTARLWDCVSGKLLTTFTGHKNAIGCVAFNRDNTCLATASWDGTVRLWCIFPNTQALIDHANHIKPKISDGKTIKPRELTPDEREQFFLPMNAPGLIQQGEKLAREGWIDKALTAYQEAQQLDSTVEIYAQSWDTLCRFGGLWGEATSVISACEQAVTLEPSDGRFRDSRGMVRALTGNLTGAIEDFKFFITWARANQGHIEHIPTRQAWITELEAGRNPFTKELLMTLRQE